MPQTNDNGTSQTARRSCSALLGVRGQAVVASYRDSRQLTIDVHVSTLMDMIKVSASGLKARMGRYMRSVRAGKEVVVTDRDEPVARLVPYSETARPERWVVASPRDPSAPPLGQVRVQAIPSRKTDTLALLREDRAKR